MTAILNHVWQSTLFTLAAWLLTLLLQRNSARTRYWLWFAASVKFLIPFVLLVDAGNRIQWRTAPAFEQPAMSIPFEQVFTAPARVFTIPETAPHTVYNWLAIFLFAWLSGFAVVIFSWSRQWLQVRASLRNAKPTNLLLPIKTMTSPALIEPGIFGILRPVLLLPEGIAERLSSDQLDAIVAHELCHVRNFDNLTAAIHMLTEAIFWFHPLIWWIGKRLLDERERACDEQVVRLGSSPEVYAESILKVCEFYLESPLDCVSGITGSDLRKRIRNIMTQSVSQNLTGGRKLLLAAAGFAAVIGPLGIGVLNAPFIRAQSRPAFEVASVRPSDSSPGGSFKGSDKNARGLGFSIEHRRVTLGGFNLYSLIVHAYGLGACRPHGEFECVLLQGGPDWLRKDQFDVVAKMPDDAPDTSATLGQFQNGRAPLVQTMLQTLLADRFHLKVHHEPKQLPIFALTVGKKGPKLKNGDVAEEPKMFFRETVRENGQRMIQFVATNSTMQELADLLGKFLDRPVLDQTGLKERYDFTLEYEENADAPGMFTGATGPGLFSAIQNQAGLRLEATKGPVQVLVIDEAERPSAN